MLDSGGTDWDLEIYKDGHFRVEQTWMEKEKGFPNRSPLETKWTLLAKDFKVLTTSRLSNNYIWTVFDNLTLQFPFSISGNNYITFL